MSVKKSEIKITVSLDENNLPVEMNWTATDAGINQEPCKALILSLWNEKEQNTLRMDLWNKDMKVDEMKMFFHQTLLTLADTFEKATGEKNISEDLRDYCFHFAEKMNILPQ
jgi:gliding motility-associated protein GldC